MTGDAVACTTEQTVLGEGARWDARRGELLGVDISAGRVYRHRVADDGALIRIRTYQIPGTVGAIAPIHGDEGWLRTAGRGFVHLSPDGSLSPLAEVALDTDATGLPAEPFRPDPSWWARATAP